MRGYKWSVILLLAALVVLQPSISSWLSVAGVAFNFVLFFFMLTAFRVKKNHVLIMSIGLGLVYDAIYSPWLGRMTIIFLLAALLVIVVSNIVYREHMPVLTLFFFVSTYLLENIKTLVELGFRIYFDKFGFIQSAILGKAAYAAALAAVFGTIFYLISMARDKRLGARKGRSA